MQRFGPANQPTPANAPGPGVGSQSSDEAPAPTWAPHEPKRNRAPSADIYASLRRIHAKGGIKPGALDVAEEIRRGVVERLPMESIHSVTVEDGDIRGIEYQDKRGKMKSLGLSELQKRIDRILDPRQPR